MANWSLVKSCVKTCHMCLNSVTKMCWGWWRAIATTSSFVCLRLTGDSKISALQITSTWTSDMSVVSRDYFYTINLLFYSLQAEPFFLLLITPTIKLFIMSLYPT